VKQKNKGIMQYSLQTN